jgi:2-dehydro-3-deoxygluconokinase
VSRLTNNPLGRLIANHAREAGVSTEHVLWTEADRIGVYFVEFGAAPRASSVLYDRKDAATARITAEMIDWPKVFAGAKWFHVTGITPALSDSTAETTRVALQAARKAGLRISIDLNFRAKLWSPQEAHRWMNEFMHICDVLITTEEDTAKVLQIKADNYEQVARQLAARYPLQVVAITLRENPLVWKNTWTAIAYQRDTVLRTRVYDVEIVDRLGAGDSFAAGLIHGLLENDLQKGLDFGVAASALKHSIPGDFAWSTLAEIEALLQGGQLRISR